jgi:adenosylcobinamide-GDP ribazoletransferase
VRTALTYLTPLPLGARPPTRTTAAWFPLAGAVIGLVVGATWWGAGEVFPPAVAAAVAVAADLLVTGALHVDGLADSADGLLPHLDGPDRRRAVMAAPDVGAFGVAAVAATLLLRWAALGSMDPDVWFVVAVWCASRSCMAVLLALGPYAGGGMGRAFDGAARWPGLAGLVAAAAVAVPAGEPFAVAAVVAVAVLVAAVARARLGGITGDVLGAAGVLGETAALVVATASWSW